MSNIVIQAEDVSKQYRIGKIGTGTVTHDLNRWWSQVRGKEDPYLKIGEANDRASKGESEYVWSLRNVNFEINQGDAVGIIGRNGAGKSTLLKLLSKVTKPTTGSFKVEGRIASLLEVGTGFHPEMSGRENIYLNGAILGMTKKEITRKFDEIVDFSGVERYIDTPVKRYSSGMYVRLAFAVAAHLESEILIVDEVLAVGDAEFQKKCLGKMGDVTAKEGRTVLFVSHNMAAVKNLCTKGIVLKNGEKIFDGSSHAAIDYYLSSNNYTDLSLNERLDRKGKQQLKFTAITLVNSKRNVVNEVFVNESISIFLSYEQNEPIDFSKLIISLIFLDVFENVVCAFPSDEMGIVFKKSTQSENQIELIIPSFSIRPGNYTVSIFSFISNTREDSYVDTISNAMSIEVMSEDIYGSGKLIRNFNCAFVKGNYKF
jgi:lipopolysaccharide transport system ATP-binding protein